MNHGERLCLAKRFCSIGPIRSLSTQPPLGKLLLHWLCKCSEKTPDCEPRLSTP